MKKLIIIDSNAIIHRAFHALPDFKSKEGESVGALYGFISFFIKTIKDHNPNFIVATFDVHAPTFRHKEYKEYKATRKKAPDELYSQIPKVKEFLKSIEVSIFEKKGFEADDVIGTICEKSPKNIEVIILTGDLDTLSLIKENVKVFSLSKGIKEGVLYDKEKVEERYDGLLPKDLLEFRALKGDPSDNIIGIPGIGEKTAIEIVKKFKNLENLYSKIEKEEVKNLKEGIIEKIKKGKESAFFSRKLSKISQDVPISFDIKKCQYKKNNGKMINFFKKYNFKSLISRISEKEKKNMTLF